MRLRREVAPIDLPLVQAAQAYLQDCTQKRTPSPEYCQAWEVFFERCDKLIRKFAGARCASDADLDDCAQAVWARLIVLLGGFEYDPRRGQFESWLYTVVRSVAVKQFRQRRRDGVELGDWASTLPDANADPAAAMDAGESRQRVSQLLARARQHLSRENYRLLLMRCIQNASVARVAQTLGIGPEQVWFRQHRMKKKLREVFSEEALVG